jgi:hypothetical protein
MGYQLQNTGYGMESNPCADKLSFLNKKDAEAARVQANFDHDNKNLTVYHCDKCDLYHLSTDHKE